MDHATPIFAGALFRMLHDAHGFRHLVVEQDPVAIEAALERPARCDTSRNSSRSHPTRRRASGRGRCSQRLGRPIRDLATR
jgi:erythromycin esterase-like protein